MAPADVSRDADLVLGRVLERGRMTDVEWCMRRYGLDGIRAFFREAARPEISERTARFCRSLDLDLDRVQAALRRTSMRVEVIGRSDATLHLRACATSPR